MPKYKDKILAIIVYTTINLALLGVGLMIAFLARPKTEVVETTQTENICVAERHSIFEVREFNQENFYHYMVEVNIKFPKIVMAQAILESSHFTSDLYVNHNNPFGMKISNNRPTLNTSEHPVYSSYLYWQSAVIDYAFFQSLYMRSFDTEEKYYTRLGQTYAEDPSYVKKIRQIP